MALTNFVVDLLRRIRPTFGNQLAHVTTYTRELPINLDRMYENAIDWEHLPFLHSSTFSEIDVIDSGDWGWKAHAYLTPKSRYNKMTLELRLDRSKNRWITKTLSGFGKGTEIWTHAIPIDDHKIKVVVDFYVPKLPGFLKAQYAGQYSALYAQLYDEDLWMMAGRQTQLDNLEKAKTTTPEISKVLGRLSEIQAQIPFTFEFNHQSYRLVEYDDTLIAHTLSCPHMLGPLEDADINEGILKCPWHGYEFDLKTRKCISGQRCQLAPAPMIKVDVTDMSVIALKKGV